MDSSNSNSAARADRVRAIREAIAPLECLAAEFGIDLDVIILPAGRSRIRDCCNLQATMRPTKVETCTPTSPVLAEGVIQFCEGYAARLLKLAERIRGKFA